MFKKKYIEFKIAVKRAKAFTDLSKLKDEKHECSPLPVRNCDSNDEIIHFNIKNSHSTSGPSLKAAHSVDYSYTNKNEINDFNSKNSSKNHLQKHSII